jgi:dolichol-phosphate mannosyltransferase
MAEASVHRNGKTICEGMNYFLIPVFNEVNNLELLHANLTTAVNGRKCFYVFSDDGSTDGSQELIEKLFANESYIILGDGSNHGPGYRFNIGFEWILQNHPDDDCKIITVEADNTSDLNILNHMLVISDLDYNLVLASVYAQGGGFEKTSFIRKLLSSIANLFLRFVFDIKVQTLSSFYRVYDIKLVRAIKNKYVTIIEDSGFLCMIEILLKAIHSDAKIIEVPMILYSERRIGKSKMKLIKTSLSYIKFLFTNRLK